MSSQTGRWRASIAITPEGRLVGHALDTRDLTRRLVVEIEADGIMIGIERCDMFTPSLRRDGFGDGCYGFVRDLAGRCRSAERWALWLANGDQLLATMTSANERPEQGVAPGHARWLGGLRIAGEIISPAWSAGRPELGVFIGAEPIEVAMAWESGQRPCQSGLAMAFDLTLPAQWADGRPHAVRLTRQDGLDLDGSPVMVLAHPRGWRGLARTGVDDAARDELHLLDTILPASLPFSAFEHWSAALPAITIADDASPVTMGVLVFGSLSETATDRTLASVTAQVAVNPVVETVGGAGASGLLAPADGVRSALARLSQAGASLVLCLRAGTVLDPLAARTLHDATPPSASLVCADWTMLTRDGRVPVFWPAFDRTRMLSQGAGEGVFAVAADADLLSGHAGLIGTYDLLIAAAARAGRRGTIHVPRLLAEMPRPDLAASQGDLATAIRSHLTRQGSTARVETRTGDLLPALAIRHPVPAGRIDIIIPTRDRADLLRSCIESLRATTQGLDTRLVVIDNASSEAGSLAYLAALAAQGTAEVLRAPGPFNYARLNNQALLRSDAPFVLLLNNDVTALAPGWLDIMMGHLGDPDVGAVGARLVWPNELVQHGGVVLGVGFAAAHGHDRCHSEEPGFNDGLRVDRECSALTAACLLLRRADVLEVGGFDERAFAVAFNDVDLCLKLRAMGRRLVWCADAALVHHESASRGQDITSQARAMASRELAELRRRWGSALCEDPCYHPALNLDRHAYSGLAWPPRSLVPRQDLPPAAGHAAL